MADDVSKDDDAGPAGEPLAEETVAEEEGYDEDAPPPGGTYEQLMDEAEANRRRANASMSLVHKEHYAFLFANCLFFAGALAAWRSGPYGANDAGAAVTHGLETIRGSLVFALALYGFWSLGIGLYTKRTVVWPLLLNMLLGLWVGLGGVVKGIGSPAWEQAYKDLYDPAKTASYSAIDKMLAGLGTIAPGYWMLTGGALLVLFILIKGIVSGASKSKTRAAEGRR
jgi:hypothetical protein